MTGPSEPVGMWITLQKRKTKGREHSAESDEAEATRVVILEQHQKARRDQDSSVDAASPAQ